MRFGVRKPSISKSFSSRTSLKKSIGIRAPKGTGMITNPEKALYNKIYNKSTFSTTSRKSSKTKGYEDSKNEGCLSFLIFIIALFVIFSIIF